MAMDLFAEDLGELLDRSELLQNGRPDDLAAQSLDPGDDRRYRNLNPLLEKSVSDGRAVIGGDRMVPILNEGLLGQKSFFDLAFRGRGELARRRPLIGDRKSLRILAICSQRGEEPRLVDSKLFFEGRALDQAFCVAPKEIPDLAGRKASVNLAHTGLLPENCNPAVHFCL